MPAGLRLVLHSGTLRPVPFPLPGLGCLRMQSLNHQPLLGCTAYCRMCPWHTSTPFPVWGSRYPHRLGHQGCCLTATLTLQPTACSPVDTCLSGSLPADPLDEAGLRCAAMHCLYHGLPWLTCLHVPAVGLRYDVLHSAYGQAKQRLVGHLAWASAAAAAAGAMGSRPCAATRWDCNRRSAYCAAAWPASRPTRRAWQPLWTLRWPSWGARRSRWWWRGPSSGCERNQL